MSLQLIAGYSGSNFSSGASMYKKLKGQQREKQSNSVFRPQFHLKIIVMLFVEKFPFFPFLVSSSEPAGTSSCSVSIQEKGKKVFQDSLSAAMSYEW